MRIRVVWMTIRITVIPAIEIRIIPRLIGIIAWTPIIVAVIVTPISKTNRPIPRSVIIGYPVRTVSKIMVYRYIDFVTFLTPSTVIVLTFLILIIIPAGVVIDISDNVTLIVI